MMTKPYPGSDEAIARGCTCPVLDNNHGEGATDLFGNRSWWMNGDCPLHGISKTQDDKSKLVPA